MKNVILAILMLIIVNVASAQSESQQALTGFNKIVVSPHISLVLVKGEQESVKLVCNNIDAKTVRVKVHGKKLLLYLDHARYIEKQRRHNINGNSWKKGIYDGVSVTAYVTYKQLKALEIRGESEISAGSEIVADKLKLRMYGQCEVDLASVKTKKFKASLYGENKLTIRDGEAEHQVYRVFGETKIDTRGMISGTANVRLYGEGRLKLNAENEVYVSAFGEPVINVAGKAIISKGIVLGEVKIARID